MAVSTYIPAREQDLAAWALNFSTLITAAPATYGLLPADAVNIASYQSAFAASLVLATDPSTKTKATVAAKDSDKFAMLEILRGYAQIIRRNNGVSNADKLSLGLTVPKTTPTPTPAPVTQPLLSIVAATPGVQTLRFADSNTPDKRSKPFGVMGMQLFVSVGLTAPVDPALIPFKAFVTKQPYGVPFGPTDVGKTAFYYGRWQTRSGLVGPWSAVAQMVVV